MSTPLSKTQERVMNALSITVSEIKGFTPNKEQTKTIETLKFVNIDAVAELEKVSAKIVKQEDYESLPVEYVYEMHKGGKCIVVTTNKSKRPIYMPLNLFKALVEMKEFPKM